MKRGTMGVKEAEELDESHVAKERRKEGQQTGVSDAPDDVYVRDVA